MIVYPTGDPRDWYRTASTPWYHAVIGTCSLCGGPVTVPQVWHGVIPPTPTCADCGAVKADMHGPVIPMRPGPKVTTGTTWTTTDQTTPL